ncbi:MAG: hypothetical protein KAQ89_03785 [Planctomycetes bacterium]|nr:hypothetical protein [Planctomycetota bacterium]
MENQTMFKIDLLKGQGIPIKSRPESIAVMAIAFIVPLLIAIIMFGYYLRTTIIISVQTHEIRNCESNTNKLAEAVNLQRSLENEKETINGCLSDVSLAIANHMQWSPVLETIVKNLPNSVVLTALSVKQEFVNKKVPSKKNFDEMISVSVPMRTLYMKIMANAKYDSAKEVRDFRQQLMLPENLGSKLKTVQVSQQVENYREKDVVFYEINCVFKSEL